MTRPTPPPPPRAPMPWGPLTITLTGSAAAAVTASVLGAPSWVVPLAALGALAILTDVLLVDPAPRAAHIPSRSR